MTSEEYIHKRFRNLSPFERYMVSNQYGRLYGASAKSYFDNTYPLWIDGSVRTSGKTVDRILECIPMILGKDERIDLVLLEVRDRIDAVINDRGRRYALFNRPKSTGDLYTDFVNLVRLESSRTNTLRWFTANAFSDKEVASFEALANYIVGSFMKKAYEGAVRDIELAREMVNGSSCQVDAKYTVKALGQTIDLAKNRYLPKQLDIQLPIPQLATEYNDKIIAFILECQVEMLKSQASGENKRTVTRADASSVNSTLCAINDARRVEAKTSHNVEAGTIELNTTRLNVPQVRKDIVSLKKKRAMAVIVGIASWIHPPLGFFVSLCSGSAILSINDEIKRKENEINEYERKRYI